MYVLLSLVVVFASSIVSYGQGKYGKDSSDCTMYLSFYTEYIKQNNYKEGAPLWRKAIQYCPPTASQNMLLDGMKIMRKEIFANRSNPIRKQELVDTLMMLHQYRIDTYPRYIIPAKTNRVMDMMNFLGTGNEKQIFDSIDELMGVAQGKTNPICIARYMNYAKSMYEIGTMTPEDVMNAFTKSMETISLAEATGKAKGIEKVKKDVESLFMTSGVANCDNLIEIFTPRFEADPNNKEVVSNIVSLLNSSDCVETDLFLQAAEVLHKMEPTFNSSYLMYKLYSSKGSYDEAIVYITEAIEDPASLEAQDAAYHFELATLYYKTVGNNAKAIANAKLAASLDDTYKGKSYMLIGTIWGGQKCSGNDIEKRAPYWVAVDYLRKAKAADPELAADANKQIAQYSKYFPQQSEAFMFDVLEGASYSVSCGGLRETTIVRTQK